MAYTSEIDKLERRWAENPKGRNFAPLADAYRKAGELDKALELCRAGLELHPDYVSAHIVYGRCLIDQKDDPGAEKVFRRVLELDPENILGLKVLAEIADRTGRPGEAVEWLTRLLAADPMNGDAAEALARAKTRAAAEPPPAPPAPPAPEPGSLVEPPPPAITDTPTTPMPAADFQLERVSLDRVSLIDVTAPGASGSPPPLATSGEIETFDGVDLSAGAAGAQKAEGLELQEEVELSAETVEPIQVEGLARTQYEGSGMFRLDAPAPPPAAEPMADEEMPQVDLPLIMPDDVEPARASHAPPVEEPAPPAPPPPPPPPRAPAPRASVPAAVALSDDDGAADTAALSEAEPVLTETMAELYLKQGHREEAARVYRALLDQRPGDARLQARLDELTGRAATPRAPATASLGQSAGSYLKGIFGGRGGPALPAAPPPVAVPATGDGSLAGAFAAEKDEEPAGPPPGTPTRPAGDHLSLDSVFGDEASRGSVVQPAPAPGPRPSGFSFDEFFGAPAPAPAAPPDAAGGKASSRVSTPKARPVEEDGDLDQFQSWLKGLKS
ncbi:MAG TPA: tetratricopeptide repeat protein [Gemmatimonadales bacterium]|nr:tetratricopeptide repeat protein [Gemmatimonadales bacterium]